MPSIAVLLLCASFVALFAGYALGRRIGRREGILEGIAYAPLELRRRSWEKGACMICGTLAGGVREDTAETGEAVASNAEG